MRFAAADGVAAVDVTAVNAADGTSAAVDVTAVNAADGTSAVAVKK